VDCFTPQKRKEVMASIGSKDSIPEVKVRKRLHALGFRFRLHSNKLAGKPDIVLPKYRSIIFVHGCFWHKHNCKRGTTPKSNLEYWDKKLDRNVERFKEASMELRKQNWKILVIWECEVKDLENIDKLANQMKSTSRSL